MAMTLSNVFGILGIIVALILFLSPVPTIRRIFRERNSLEYSQLPFICQVVESSFWTLWAISVGDRLEMLVNNIIGISFMLIYIIIFSSFVPASKRSTTALHLSVAAVLVGVGVAALCLLPKSSGSLSLSIAAVVLNCIKYASPLSVARMVVQTKSVEFLPLPLTLACFACSVLWGTYGLLLNDMWILVPNIAGVVCSILQVILWCCYCRRSTSSKKDPAVVVESSSPVVEIVPVHGCVIVVVPGSVH